MSSVLVTGATGLVGSHAVKELVAQGQKVIALDQLLPTRETVLDQSILETVEFVRGDILDLPLIINLISDFDIRGIVHTAVVQPPNAHVNPAHSLNVNIMGTVNMLEAVRLLKLDRLICCSSAAAAGIKQDLSIPVKEDDPITPPISGLYPSAKLAIETICYNYRKLYGVNVSVVRPHRVYGAGIVNRPPIRYHGPQFFSHPIARMVSAAVAGQDVVWETGADDSMDFSYVKDTVKGILLAYQKQDPKYDIYNVSFGANRTVGECARILQDLFPKQRISIGSGSQSPPVGTVTAFSSIQQVRVLRPPQSLQRAREDLGYEPEWPIEKAIPDYVNFLLSAQNQ